MDVGTFGRCLAALTLIGLTGTGCTPEPTPTPSPTPSVSQTPTESPQERQQRLDYEAAETSYRAFRGEYGRVMNMGGAREATALMKATAGGKYLSQFEELVQAFHGLGDHSSGQEKIIYVRRTGYSAESIALDVCEDSRDVRDIDKNGKQVGVGEIRTAQLEVHKVGQHWKLWSGKGKRVASCS